MTYILIILFLFWLILILVYLIYMINAFFTDAPYVPVKKSVVKKIVETLKINENSVLYDLGCGDGRLMIEANKKFKDIKAIGVEKNIIIYLLAKLITRKTSIKIVHEDINNVSLKDATHIYLYLFPKIMDKLRKKIQNECRVGTRIVSCTFKFTNVIPDEIIDLPVHFDKTCKNLYVYIIK